MRGLRHGRPTACNWPSRQLCYAPNGYRCEEGVIFYQETRQRVRLLFDEVAIREAEAAIRDAWELAGADEIPPPLVDSPKCPGCSLVGICMPDETWLLQQDLAEVPRQLALFDHAPTARPHKMKVGSARLLMAPRVDRRPLYLNTQGLRVGKTGNVLRVKEKDKVVQDVRIGEVCQVNLMGNVQLSTQAVQTLCNMGTPVCYFSFGGWFYGVTTGLNTKNVFLRKSQFRLSDEEWYCLRLARRIVAGKILNQRVMLLRNHIEPPRRELKGNEAVGQMGRDFGFHGGVAWDRGCRRTHLLQVFCRHDQGTGRIC